MKEIDSA